jgi:hypothetical protein
LPSFCRHNRFEDSCPICSKNKQQVSAPKRPTASSPSRPRKTKGPRPGRAPRTSAGVSALTVRRAERAPDDGYDNALVPGLRSSEDARRLAEALSFSAARLEKLSNDPPGLYARVASEPDREEAAWLCFLIAYVSPLEGDEPFAAIEAAHVPWATGELPHLDGIELGPRTAHDQARGTRTIEAYRAWAAKSGSQVAGLAGDAALSPQRRFDQLWTRLALPGFRRSARFEFLLLCSRLGLADVEPWTLKYADAEVMSPVGTAARRVFASGDAIELQKRSARLMEAVGLSMGALDLGLWDWGSGERLSGGVGVLPAALANGTEALLSRA